MSEYPHNEKGVKTLLTMKGTPIASIEIRIMKTLLPLSVVKSAYILIPFFHKQLQIPLDD